MQTIAKKRILKTISILLNILIVLATIFALMCISFNFVYAKTRVRGYSMRPTLNANTEYISQDGDTIFINKYAKINKNDIVVAQTDWWKEGPVIKRLIATAGDTVFIKDATNHYELYVNDKIILTKEKYGTNDYGTIKYYTDYSKYILANIGTDRIVKNANNDNVIKIFDNELFIMGDNWAESTDCVKHGPISKDNVLGKVDIIVANGDDLFPEIVKQLFTIIFK